MNLKIVFRIYAAFGIIFILLATLSPEGLMEPYGFTMNEGMITMVNFMIGFQMIIVLVTWQLPEWLGDDLSKAGLTYVGISLIPAIQGLYLMSTGALPASTSGYVETSIWCVFAALFYFYSRKGTEKTIITPNAEEEE